MKKIALISAAALSVVISFPTNADKKTANNLQRVSTFSATTIAGALAGGPLGMIAGAVGGAYLSEQSKHGFETREALILRVNNLEKSLDNKENDITQLENRIVHKLEFHVMFATGEDELSLQEIERIRSLTKYLQQNPELKVRLDGHSDPRGTDEYNNILSAERAKSVAVTLIENGIEESRIEVHSHGSSFATSGKANRDQYAFQRRVNIKVFSNHHIASSD